MNWNATDTNNNDLVINLCGDFVAFEIGDAAHFSFSWFRKKSFWRYVFYYWGLLLLAAAAFGVLVLSFFGDYVSMLLSGNNAGVAALLASDIASGLLFTRLLLFLVISVPLLLILMLSGVYIEALMTIFGLKAAKLKSQPLTLSKFVGLIGLAVAYVLSVLFYAFDKKLRLWQWVSLAGILLSLVLIVLGQASLLFPLVGVLILLPAFFVYFFVVVIAGLRLYPIRAIYLSKNIGIIDCLKESFKLTKGKLFDIFLTNIVVQFFWAIASFFFIVLVGMALGALLFPLAHSLDSGFVSAVLSSKGLTAVPGSQLFVFTSYIGYELSGLIVLPFYALVLAFLNVGIYLELLKKDSLASKPATLKK